VDEDLAATHLLEEDQLGGVVEERDELEWCVALAP
jgi:hypothetical protein